MPIPHNHSRYRSLHGMENNVVSFLAERAHSHSTSMGTETVSFIIGDLVVLPCFPNLKVNVRWVYHSTDSTKPVHEISVSGRIKDGFVQRFFLSVTYDGHYNLILHQSRQSDAGLYICMEEDGVGQSHYVQLITTGKNLCRPNCRDILLMKIFIFLFIFHFIYIISLPDVI